MRCGIRHDRGVIYMNIISSSVHALHILHHACCWLCMCVCTFVPCIAIHVCHAPRHPCMLCAACLHVSLCLPERVVTGHDHRCATETGTISGSTAFRAVICASCNHCHWLRHKPVHLCSCLFVGGSNASMQTLLACMHTPCDMHTHTHHLACTAAGACMR